MEATNVVLDNDPRLIAICTHCIKPDCPGECATYNAAKKIIVDGCSNVALYTYKGVTMTLKDWADKLGISYIGLYHRIKTRGMSIEQAIALGGAITATQYEAFGKCMTMPEWSREYGINEYTLRRRIRVGMPLEKALTLPVETKYKGGM